MAILPSLRLPRTRRPASRVGLPILLAVLAIGSGACITSVAAQTVVNGASLALRSTGSVSGSSVQLAQNGYVGTYITLSQPGNVTLSVAAAGQAAGGTPPRMNVVINDTRMPFDVTSSTASYAFSVSLPAGTHFVRTELQNDTAAVDRRLTVSSLTVSGAAVSNSNSTTNALNAADTYIANYRRGPATISFPDAIPGSTVNIRLKKHAFRFGSTVPGTSLSGVNAYLTPNPVAGSTAATFQSKFVEHFNSVSPSNAGKWAYNEASQNVVTMSAVDSVLNFAQRNGMRTRMHNLIWGSQQPTYINTLLTSAQAGNVASINTLKSEISQRVQYYVADRVGKFDQIDVYNESIHTTQYWNALGVSGVADVYNQVNTAAAGTARTFTNEYNVLADSADSYSNWYRSHVESIREAGGAVGGIGIQYYAYNQIGGGNSVHNAARIHQILQNLSVPGLPLELTEFGIKDNGTGTFAEDQVTAAEVLKQTLRMAFGTPAMTGFTLWGFWAGDVWDQAPMAPLYDNNWNLTPAGQAYVDLMTADNDSNTNDDWTTNVTLPIAPDGTVNLTGFYGDYDVTVYGKTFPLTLAKGTTAYSQMPASWKLTTGGAWETTTNWRDGVPGGVGQTANFLTQLSAPSTVVLSSARTLGNITFNSAHGYTIGGSTITLNNNASEATITVATGNHTIASSLNVLSPLSVNVMNSGASLSLTQPIGAPSLTKSGPGTLSLPGITTTSMIISGGLVRLDGATPSTIASLVISDGQLDLTTSDLLLDYTGASPIAGLIDAVRAGSIIFSDTNLDGLPAYLGISEAEDLGVTSFAGRPLDSSAVLLVHTYAGDANLDGQVNALDYERIDLAIGNTGVLGPARGDLNYDSIVDALDYEQVDLNIGNGVIGGSSVFIPEPGQTAVTVGILFCAWARRPNRVRHSRFCV